jgi:predicted permease
MNWWFRKSRRNEIERELLNHLELEAAEQRSEGRQSDEATYAARRALGNFTRIAEDARAVWTLRWLEEGIADLRFALRISWRRPGVTALIIAILALGVDANTAIFSVVSAVLLKPLPYRNADRLVTVWGNNRQRASATDPLSPLDYQDWRTRNHVFSEMAASVDEMYTLTGRGNPAPLLAYSFSANFFHVLGVSPLLGRTFSPAEEHAGEDHVAILSYHLWQTRFAGDPNVIGQTAVLDEIPHTIIGVMPEGVTYPGQTELWTPLVFRPDSMKDRNDRFLRVLAKLRPGVTQEQAAADMNAIAAQLTREHPATNKDIQSANLISLRNAISGDIRAPLLLLMCAAGFVLLIACANVANLLLLRGVARRAEIATRTAIGAGYGRLLRQLLAESLLLSSLASLCGLGLAFACVRMLLPFFPRNVANLEIPQLDRILIDGPVLLFALLAGFVTASLFGILPALELQRFRASSFLKESSRKLTGDRSSSRARTLLTALEVAVSVLLLIAAGLMLKSFAHLMRGNLGLNPDHLLTLRLVLPADKYPNGAKLLPFSDALLSQLNNLPGVRSAAATIFLPLSGWSGSRPITRIGDTKQAVVSSMWSSVTSDYFRTMQIALVAGRAFDSHDRQGSVPVAVLSKSLAHRLFPRGDALGKVLNASLSAPVQVIGIVDDVHHQGMTSDATSQLYLSFAQFPYSLLCIAVRTVNDPMALATQVENAVWSLDKNQAISFLMPMSTLASETVSTPRVLAFLLGVFAALALLMAVVGIYGVVSFGAAQRIREVGVRIAMGATSRDILLLIAGQAALPITLGLLIGIAASFAMVRLLAAFLYGVEPIDGAVFLLVPVAILSSAALASYIPASKAMRIDPTAALRYE